MTAEKLNNIIIKLKCCSANMTKILADNLLKGSCDNSEEIFILNSYIEELLVYYSKLSAEENTFFSYTCLDEDQYENIINQAKNICELCDCGTIIENTYSGVEAIPDEGESGGEFVNPNPF